MTNAGFSQVGNAILHDSAYRHVSGEATYVDDMVPLQTQYHAVVGGSRIAHGKISSMDLDEVKSAPGVVDVITAADIPGRLDIGPVFPGDPLLTDGTVEYLGQPLFAVAATTRTLGKRAVALAKVDYEQDRPVLDLEQAINAAFHVRPPHVMQRGDSEKAIKNADHRVAFVFTIGGQDHFYLEGQVSIAIPEENGGVTIYSSTQNPTETQKLVSEVLAIPMNRVNVVTRRMGGGFGGKETQAAPWSCIAAVFASRLQAAITCRLSRRDDMVMTGKRHNFRNFCQAGFDNDGLIKGVRYQLAGQCGYSPDLSDAIVDRAMFHCSTLR